MLRRCLPVLLLLAATPAGAAAATVQVEPDEVVASANTQVRIEVTLDWPLAGGRIAVRAPGALGRTPASGIRATTLRSRALARLGHARYELVFTDNGLPAGRYEIPLTLVDDAGAEHALPPARLVVEARRREGEEGDDERNPWAGLEREALDVTADAEEESEAFVAVDPNTPANVLSAANSAGGLVASRSSDGGTTWTRHALPLLVDTGAGVEQQEYVCDPVVAADPGTGSTHPAFWFGGVTECTSAPSRPSRVVLARVDETTGAVTGAVGLPIPAGSDAQDKPMIAFDPALRRLYATWISFSGVASQVVLAWCEAGADGRACEDGGAWHAPVAVTPPGSYTYPDVAVGPDGGVELVWWNYSNANAIAGAQCAAPCNGTFAQAHTIALLDSTGGAPLPFGCPILVAPGGRVGAAPNVEVDRDGRVWVAWGDLRADSGVRRCEAAPGGGFTPPSADQLTWDSFVASEDGGLPGGEAASVASGTRVMDDGAQDFAAGSDDFFGWLATDRTTGRTWMALYSTGRDPTRRSALFFALSLRPDGSGRHFVGPPNELAAAPSSYWSTSTADCCRFQNDFGDYEGAAAAQDRFYATWSDNSGGDGEAYIWRGPLQTVAFALEGIFEAEGPGADGDGQFEPGERVTLRARLRNTGTSPARGLSSEGPLVTLQSDAGATATAPTAQLPVLEPGQAAQTDRPLELAIDDGYDCARPLGLRLAASAREGASTLPLPLPVACPPVTPTPTPSVTVTPTPPQITTLAVPRRQELSQVLRRGVLVTAGCGEPCRVSLRSHVTTRAQARRLHLPQALGGRKIALTRPAQGLRIRITARARRAVRRALARHERRVPLRVTARLLP